MNTSHNTRINVWIFIFSVAIAIIIAIFVGSKEETPGIHIKDYTEDIRSLNDSIVSLQKEIEEYERCIAEIEFEKQKLRKVITEILEENEKTDSAIVNGDLDANVRFLSDYLSKDHDFGQGHGSLHNTGSVDKDK